MGNWHFSQRGIFGLFFCFFVGLLHVIFMAAIAENDRDRWTMLGFDIDSPIWFILPWILIGVIFFVWAGWYFPAQARKKMLEYRSAFSQPGE